MKLIERSSARSFSKIDIAWGGMLLGLFEVARLGKYLRRFHVNDAADLKPGQHIRELLVRRVWPNRYTSLVHSFRKRAIIASHCASSASSVVRDWLVSSCLRVGSSSAARWRRAA